MEALIFAVADDIVSRFISFIAQNFCNHTQNENDHGRLEHVLLRIHTIVEEAEERCMTNQGMLLQLKMLIKDMYVGNYMLDRLKIQSIEEDKVEGEVSHQNRSFAISTLNAAKRLRFASPTRKNTPVASGTRRSAAKLKGILECLETKIKEMREFVILLVSCPQLPCKPYSTYLFMDRCMFGHYTEKEQIISFLVCNDTHDCPNLEILPILGPHRVGKKTLVQHACKDERVHNCFSDILFLKGDDLGNGKFSANLKVNSGKCLFVIEFSWGVDEVAWTDFKSYLQNVVGAGSKIVLIGRTQEVAKFGAAHPIWLKSLSQEEYWYYFKALAFGSMDPDEHPRLASPGMQLATYFRDTSFLFINGNNRVRYKRATDRQEKKSRANLDTSNLIQARRSKRSLRILTNIQVHCQPNDIQHSELRDIDFLRIFRTGRSMHQHPVFTHLHLHGSPQAHSAASLKRNLQVVVLTPCARRPAVP